jgi:hypothetical protein
MVLTKWILHFVTKLSIGIWTFSCSVILKMKILMIFQYRHMPNWFFLLLKHQTPGAVILIVRIGCLLLLGTWYHLWCFQGSVLQAWFVLWIVPFNLKRILILTADFVINQTGRTDFDCGLFHLRNLNILILTTDFCIWNGARGRCYWSTGDGGYSS